MKRLVYTSLIAFVLDRIIKLLVKSLVSAKEIVVIKNFFNITLAYNFGGAWSILNGYRWLLILASIAALVLIYFVYRNERITRRRGLILGMLVGGIVGNLWDRIKYGYVIDYLAFNIFGYHFPIFNLADSLIVISIILLIIIEFKGGKHVRG